ncbi:MAG: tRNA (adenosine(37)-N6)-dimethylallyltransferase MiaA [Rhodospirillaceae bacterium]|nr:tRNA (adenosine(37)-N6)-dimethylallyltransferase MiaA [Rhodospirillaceae bacterium]
MSTHTVTEASNEVVVVAGPTASGKSALAADLAEDLGGVVINADSMQVYRDLAILTARPDAAAEARAPHRLYGVIDGAEACSAARWRQLALVEIAEAQAAGLVPIVVGGTGLYLRALTGGLAPVPEIPAPVRAAALAMIEAEGLAALRADLVRRDPVMAQRLRPRDRQRLIRAWEVVTATGRSLAQWQADPTLPGPAASWVIVLPERADLYAACNARLLAMVAAGALEEVRRLVARGLDPGLPVMKALGVPEFIAHLHGEMALQAAVAAAQQATRRYAKRQTTWLRTQVIADPRRVHIAAMLDTQYSESHRQRTVKIIRARR